MMAIGKPARLRVGFSSAPALKQAGHARESITDNAIEDHALMRRIGQGDAEAYRLLVRKHLAASLRFAERMLGSRADAEDVLQEVHWKLWKEAPNWKPQAKYTTWFYRVVFNACIDQQRRRKPMAEAEMEAMADHSPLVDERMIENERAARVAKAVASLPEKQRAALALSYYEGVSNADAAAVLGMNLSALQVMLYRARAQLKELLKEEEA